MNVLQTFKLLFFEISKGALLSRVERSAPTHNRLAPTFDTINTSRYIDTRFLYTIFNLHQSPFPTVCSYSVWTLNTHTAVHRFLTEKPSLESASTMCELAVLSRKIWTPVYWILTWFLHQDWTTPYCFDPLQLGLWRMCLLVAIGSVWTSSSSVASMTFFISTYWSHVRGYGNSGTSPGGTQMPYDSVHESCYRDRFGVKHPNHWIFFHLSWRIYYCTEIYLLICIFRGCLQNLLCGSSRSMLTPYPTAVDHRLTSKHETLLRCGSSGIVFKLEIPEF